MSSMKRIVGSIILNKCYGKEWILSEYFVDLVRISTYCLGEDDNEDVSKLIDAMVEEKGNLQAVENLCMNLIEVH